MTDEPDIEGLKGRVKLQLERHLASLQLPAAMAGDLSAHLFSHVADVGLREADQRRLTSGDLDQVILAYSDRRRQTAAPDLLASFNQDTIAAFGQNSAKLEDLEAQGRDISKKIGAIADAVGVRLDETEHLAADGRELSQIALDTSQGVERDLAARYAKALRQAMFTEFAGRDLYVGIADEVLEPKAAHISSALRRRILLRAARSAAVGGDLSRAERLLAEAVKLTGDDSDIPARARIAQAKGDVDEALRLVRDDANPDSRSVFLSILSSAERGEDALDWITAEGIRPDMLTDGGAHVLAHIYLRRDDFDGFLGVAQGVSEAQCHDGPQLLFLRGAARFASIFGNAARQLALQGIPTGARFAEPESPGGELAQSLELAIADFDRVLALKHDLDLNVTASTAERFRRWAELLHPDRKRAAVQKLRADLAEPSSAIRVLQFAIALDVPFDAKAVAEALDRRERAGGLGGEELAAAFALALSSKDPVQIAAFIEKRRDALEDVFDKGGVRAAQIQALIESGDLSAAKARLADLPAGLVDDRRALLRAEIAKAEGADAIVEHEQAYAATNSTDALRALVQALVDKRDRLGVATRAQELYQRTGDIGDLRLAARALASLGNETEFLALVAEHPDVAGTDNELIHHHAGVLLKLGRLSEASEVVARLAEQGPRGRALDLEIAIAVASGAWETLGALTTVFLDPARDDDGVDLLRAANIAQVAGSGPVLELIDAAVKKSPDSAEVLIGAYMLIMAEGLEDKRPQFHDWFQRAVDLSGEDGPVQRFELKDVLADHLNWVEHTGDINTRIRRAELPLAVAARGLRTSVVDVVLGSLVRNAHQADPRKRSAMPLFAGNRAPTKIGSVQRVAFDLSALLTLSWLKILPKVLNAYSGVLIPAGVMSELFEARQRIRRAQQSRIIDAQEIVDQIAQGRLKVYRTQPSVLAERVGDELASLMDAALADGGVVVRPAPVNRPGKLEEEADVAEFQTILADMHALLEALVEAGALTAAQEKTTRNYFKAQDTGWSAPAAPQPDKALYLDELAIAYLQGAGLLKTVLGVFERVFVDTDVEERARALLDDQAHIGEVLSAIDDTRTAVRAAAEAGRATFGASRSGLEEGRFTSSTFNLIHDLRGADCVVVDDRAMNKEPFASDRSGHRARVVTTLDVIEDLLALGVLTAEERLANRHKLRVGGACLMPMDVDEVASAVLRNRQADSAEFRAIRENLLLTRMAQTPSFPAEMMWFGSIVLSVKNAIKAVWNSEQDHPRAQRHSSVLMAILPRPQDWRQCWEGGPPPGWVESTDQVVMASLTMPVELNGSAVRDAYNAWLEEDILDAIRLNTPRRYEAMVAQTKSFILDAGNIDEDADDGD